MRGDLIVNDFAVDGRRLLSSESPGPCISSRTIEPDAFMDGFSTPKASPVAARPHRRFSPISWWDYMQGWPTALLVPHPTPLPYLGPAYIYVYNAHRGITNAHSTDTNERHMQRARSRALRASKLKTRVCESFSQPSDFRGWATLKPAATRRRATLGKVSPTSRFREVCSIPREYTSDAFPRGVDFPEHRWAIGDWNCMHPRTRSQHPSRWLFITIVVVRSEPSREKWN